MDYYGPLHIHSRLPHQQKRYSYDHTTSYPAPYTPSYFDIAHLPLMPLQQGIYKRQFYAHQQQQTHQLLGTYQPQPLHPWPWLAKCRAPTAAATTTFDMDWSAENGGGDAATRGEASTISGVDELMRVIQDKSLKPSSGTSSSDSGEAAGTSTDGGRSKTVGDTGSGAGASIDASTRAGNSKKQYECHIGECRKAFLQFSHLEIHTRVHTGEKPYVRPFTSSSSLLPPFLSHHFQPIPSHSQPTTPTKTADANNSPNSTAPTPPARAPFPSWAISELTIVATLGSAPLPATFAARASAKKAACAHTHLCIIPGRRRRGMLAAWMGVRSLLRSWEI